MDLLSAFRLHLDPTHPEVVALVGAGGKTTTLFRLANEIVTADHRAVTTTTTRIFAGQIAQSPAHLVVEDEQIDWSALSVKLDEHGQCLLVTGLAAEKAVGVSPQIVDEVARRSVDLGIAAVIVEADGSRRFPLKTPAAHEPVIPDSTTLLVPLVGLNVLGRLADAEHIHRVEQVYALLGIDGETRITPSHLAKLLVHIQGGAKDKPTSARFLPILNQAESAPQLAAARIAARLMAEQGFPSLISAVAQDDRPPVLERWGPTVAVVLAAGGSRRMGEAKQLLDLGGEPLVVRAARTALAGTASHVIVVSGARGEAVHAALRPLLAQTERLHLVHNPAWESGQATSVLAAMDALPTGCEAVQFLPVDQPFVPPTLLRVLWERWRGGADLVAPNVDGEMRGAPAVFDQRYFAALRQLHGDQGARPILRQNSADVVTVTTPALWLSDADTPEEWARIRDFPQ
ncbi:putative selenium-dependent hydroxylase accessory protein YqeC [bacterium]|nr:putative selenium-dependent hydroxylase accessory protein YqeC [bacterium]